ncbi:MAG: nitrous oxide reductase accessory protein NosL [Sterolibacterium sp.]|nr:nitrous oxide reductase accessory protein NosL [Sterolibacterium sp.]
MSTSAGRRTFLAHLTLTGLASLPLASLVLGCARQGLPDGLVDIKWDRDTCTRCGMVISDRRFAVQLRGGTPQQAFKFDDIGCAVTWLKAQSWGSEPATRIWVMDAADMHGNQWLDARTAHYVHGKVSPMAYNYAAIAQAQAGSLDFNSMQQQVLLKEKKA